MEERAHVVCGRRIEQFDAAVLREWVRHHEGVIVDLGTGDGRWLYRLARTRSTHLCLGVDANAGMMREISHRASRKPSRGGLPNIRFIAAAVESLPAGLSAIADEVWVSYPWGSLLRAVLAPEPSILRGVAGLLKPQGVLRVAINESVLDQAAILGTMKLLPRPPQVLSAAVRAGYNEVGLKVTTWRYDTGPVHSSWGARLGQGAGLRTLRVDAVKDGLRAVDLGGKATTSGFTEE